MIVLLLVLAQDPAIRSVDPLVEGVRRGAHWVPLAVTLESSAEWSGDVEIASAFGFTVRRAVRVPAGGSVRILVPAVAPEEVRAGEARTPVPAGRGGADILVGVDGRLEYADRLESGSRVAVRVLAPGDLRTILEEGMADAFDLVLLPPGGEPAPPARVAPTLAEARVAIEAVRGPRPAITAVDPRVRNLVPVDPGGGAKREAAVFFAVVYAFAAFAAISAASRRSGRTVAAAVAGVSVLGLLAFAVLFPRGRVWAVAETCRVVRDGGRAEEWRAWFIGSSSDVRTRLEFSALAKPVFRDAVGAREPFVLRVVEGGCRVEDLRLGPGRVGCFAIFRGVAGAAPGRPLAGAGVVKGDLHLDLGDLGEGEEVPEPGERGRPSDPGVAAFGALLPGSYLYGRRDAAGGPGLRSPDLDTPARLRPVLQVEERE